MLFDVRRSRCVCQKVVKAILFFWFMQREARVVFPQTVDSPPILHLPLAVPLESSRPLTTWVTINMHLPTVLPYFSSLAPRAEQGESGTSGEARSLLPRGSFGHSTYLKIYASCRVRRVWFSTEGPGGAVPWEFGLYSTG